MMDSILYLKNQKMKVTKGRIAIIDKLLSSKNAVTVEDIFESCKENDESVDLSTVYRTVDNLESKDLISKFDLGDGKYSYLLKEKVHKHIIECDLCHKKMVIDCPIPQIEEQIRAKTGITLTESHVYLKGICKDCKK